MKIKDLEALALGAGILGSGGGGNPKYDLLIAKGAMLKHGEVHLISLSDLSDEDWVLPMNYIGAPLVGMEKIPSGKEFFAIYEKCEKLLGKIKAIYPTEIGGGNAFAPFPLAAETGIPILDADEIGRAFPRLEMSSVFLYGISPSFSMIADEKGNLVTIEAKDEFQLEEIARQVTISMGSSAALMLHPLQGKVAKQALVGGSLSRALSLGYALADGLTTLLGNEKGAILAKGMIVSIEQKIEGGFLLGSVTIRDASGSEIVVFFKNEYLLAERGARVLACTPDIICLLDEDSLKPLTTDLLSYGLRVCLIALPSPEIWLSAAGLDRVGPQAFGFTHSYQRFGGTQ